MIHAISHQAKSTWHVYFKIKVGLLTFEINIVMEIEEYYSWHCQVSARSPYLHFERKNQISCAFCSSCFFHRNVNICSFFLFGLSSPLNHLWFKTNRKFKYWISISPQNNLLAFTSHVSIAYMHQWALFDRVIIFIWIGPISYNYLSTTNP